MTQARAGAAGTDFLMLCPHMACWPWGETVRPVKLVYGTENVGAERWLRDHITQPSTVLFYTPDTEGGNGQDIPVNPTLFSMAHNDTYISDCLLLTSHVLQAQPAQNSAQDLPPPDSFPAVLPLDCPGLLP